VFHLHLHKLGFALLFVSLLFTPAAWSQDAPEVSTLTLEETVNLKQVIKAVISPTEEAVAYLLSVPRKLYEDGAAWKQLPIVDLEGETRPYFSAEVSVSDLAWSVDGDAIFFVGRRDVKAELPNIYRIPMHGGEAQVIFEAKSEIKSIHPSPDGGVCLHP